MTYTCRRCRKIWGSHSFLQNCCWITLQVSHHQGWKTCVKMEGKCNFSRRLKQFDGLVWLCRQLYWKMRWDRPKHQTASGASKNCFPFHFDTSLSSLMMRNLQDYPMTVLRERIWHFRGSKHTLTPPTRIQVVKTSQPPGSTPTTVALTLTLILFLTLSLMYLAINLNPAGNHSFLLSSSTQNVQF